MSFTSLPANSVDAKSPIDDFLMGLIKDDLDDLNSRVVAAGAKPFVFEVQGKLSFITDWKRSIAAAILNEAAQPSQARFMLKKSGTSALAFDIRKHTSPNTPITAISHQYTAATQSIARAGSALSTQSIARFVAQISTQSITHAKAAKNILSIISLGTIEINGVITTDVWQYNLSATIDSDTLVGDSFVAASATSGGNNGTFVILEKNRTGGNNVVITNASGVAQTGAAGTIQEKIMSYNYTNPVSATGFAAGFAHDFLAHTTPANNGDLLVYAINQGGNNVWVKNPTGAAQAGVAGTLDTNFWTFAFTGAASVTDYIVGETVLTASHTSGGNNAAALQIVAVNSGGNNLVLYNTAGVTQGGVLGNVNTNRWIYSLPGSPAADVSAGQTMYLLGHTNPLNDGTFTIKEVNRSAANNVVIYNLSGVAQGGAVGNVYHTRKLIQFAADQSAIYTVLSFIEMQGTPDSTYRLLQSRAPFQVLEVNRGGGANYNVVIDNPTGAAQASPSGFVCLEMKSVFSAAPTLAADLTSLEPNQDVKGTSTSFVVATIPANTPLGLYLTSIPTGDPRDLTVTIL